MRKDALFLAARDLYRFLERPWSPVAFAAAVVVTRLLANL